MARTSSYKKYEQRQKTKIRPKERLYIAGLDWDFTWLPGEVEDIIHLWDEGVSLFEIASQFSRKQEEVAVLVMDLAHQKRVKSRDGGLFGKRGYRSGSKVSK